VSYGVERLLPVVQPAVAQVNAKRQNSLRENTFRIHRLVDLTCHVRQVIHRFQLKRADSKHLDTFRWPVDMGKRLE
jgi:hypothetical protein